MVNIWHTVSIFSSLSMIYYNEVVTWHAQAITVTLLELPQYRLSIQYLECPSIQYSPQWYAIPQRHCMYTSLVMLLKTGADFYVWGVINIRHQGNLEPTSENAMADQADHVAGGSDDGNDGNNKSSQTATPTPTSRMNLTTTTKHQYCITECQHGHSSSGNMIRCRLCYGWCHEDCVKFDKNLDTRWFVCPPCHGMSHRIHDIENTMSVLLNTVNELATVNAELVSTNERLTNEIRKLNSEQQVIFPSLNTIQCPWKSANPSKPRKPDLLIGSSIIRD